jgi:hypothetical protein
MALVSHPLNLSPLNFPSSNLLFSQTIPLTSHCIPPSFEGHGLAKREQGSSSSSLVQQLTRTYSHVVEDDFIGLGRELEMLVGHLVQSGFRLWDGRLGKVYSCKKERLIEDHPCHMADHIPSVSGQENIVDRPCLALEKLIGDHPCLTLKKLNIGDRILGLLVP